MSTVLLSFTSVDDNFQVRMYTVNVPEHTQKEIISTLSLSGNRDFVLSHGRFSDFTPHNKELLENILSNPKLDLKALSLDDLVFLCAVFHNLNLKARLLTIAQFTINNHSISFEDLKERARESKYRMIIYAK